MKQTRLQKSKKVLVITGPGIGDAVLSVPLFNTLRENLPDAQIDSISWTLPGKKGDSLGKTILEKSCKIDNIIEMDQRLSILSKITRALKIISRRYDLVIDCYPGTNKTALFSFFAGKKTAGFEFNKNYSILYNIKIKPNRENKVVLESNLLKKIGFEVKTPKLVDFSEKNKKTNAIGVSFSRDSEIYRSWSDENWAMLLDKLNRKVIFVGTDSNLKRINSVRKMMKNRKTNVFLNKTIQDVVDLISGLDLFITENNGIMHLATTTNVQLIALCGPSFYGWGPYGENSTEIRAYTHSGGPCDKSSCKKGCIGSMSKITIDQVLKEVNKKLSK